MVTATLPGPILQGNEHGAKPASKTEEGRRLGHRAGSPYTGQEMGRTAVPWKPWKSRVMNPGALSAACSAVVVVPGMVQQVATNAVECPVGPFLGGPCCARQRGRYLRRATIRRPSGAGVFHHVTFLPSSRCFPFSSRSPHRMWRRWCVWIWSSHLLARRKGMSPNW